VKTNEINNQHTIHHIIISYQINLQISYSLQTHTLHLFLNNPVKMKTSIAFLAALIATANAFAPTTTPTFLKTTTALSMAKFNTMDEILAKFPEDMPILINFYDSATEGDIKGDIVRAKNLLKDRCTVVSIKQQDYPGE
jgi:hypothetical protein